MVQILALNRVGNEAQVLAVDGLDFVEGSPEADEFGAEGEGFVEEGCEGCCCEEG